MAKARKKTPKSKASIKNKIKKAKPGTRSVAARAKRRPQRFTVSHYREQDFDQGLRTYAKYVTSASHRRPATGGMVQAHVIRFIPPFKPEEISKPHYHDIDLQMIYVLKGWYKTEFEGEGVHTFREGACWLQPPKIKHTVLGYSDDCELLEIVLPAQFDTVTLEK